MWIKDPNTKEASVTLTAFICGFGVATLKLLFSGITIGSFNLSQFSGGDFAAVVGAVGALYWAKRNAKFDNKDKKE